MFTSRPGTLLPCLSSFLLSSNAVSLRLFPPPSYSLGHHPYRCVANLAQCRLILVPLSHEAFCFFEDPAIPLAPLLSCNGPHLGLHPKTNLECSVDPLVASNDLRSTSRHLCQLFNCPPGLRPSPPVAFPSITRPGNRPSFCRVTRPPRRKAVVD